MARTPSPGARVVVGLLVSVAVHAAALSLVTIDIPRPDDGRIELVRMAARPAEAETSPPIRVIEIRPPGARLPSGGGASGQTAEIAVQSVDPGASAVLATAVRRPARPAADGGVSTVALAPRAPLVPMATVALASAPAASSDEDDRAATSSSRPGRGVVLRGPGESGGTGSVGRGSVGRGIGPGTGGLTITGPGGDCITPGTALPGRTGPVSGSPLGAGARAAIGGSGRRGVVFRPR